MSASRTTLNECAVLLVDDEQSILLSLRDSLKDAGAKVLTAASGNQAIDLFKNGRFDVVISDVRMPGLSGLDLLEQIRKLGLDTEVVLMTAYANVEHAVAAMRAGAYDYVTKPFPDQKMVRVVENIWSLTRLRSEVRALRASKGIETDLSFLIGRSAPWRAVVDKIRTVATSDSTVLVVGPSGTGKELVARALHVCSNRSAGPFIKLHCASLPASLMEAEFFGHEKGAYTGAGQQAKGRFELASGGTLLLDEVDDIPMEVQVKLLRVLQEHVIERVGSGHPIPVDVRIVAASKGRLEDMVAKGTFRSDLFYRLSVVNLRLPRLAERRDDVPLLLDYFLSQAARRANKPCPGFTREALDSLLRYDYLGNVRELEHIVESACALCGGEPMGVELLSEAVREQPKTQHSLRIGFFGRPLADVMEEFEKSYLEQCLREFAGSRTNLAAALGISRKALWQKLKKFELVADDAE